MKIEKKTFTVSKGIWPGNDSAHGLSLSQMPVPAPQSPSQA
jgi:hypothetical protein